MADWQSNGMLTAQMQNMSIGDAQKGYAIPGAAYPGVIPGVAYTPVYAAAPPPVAAVDPAAIQAPPLSVRVEGLSFQYQFTEDDVRKVFSRYGDVVHVTVA